MFYDKFVALSQRKGMSPSAVAIDAGISKSLVSKWKNNPITVPSMDVLRKLSKYFNVSIEYLLEMDVQSQIDSATYKINALKKDLVSATGTQKEEIEYAIAVLEESKEDLLLAQMLTAAGENGHKKSSPYEESLTEGEQAMLALFRQIPAEQQQMVLSMLRAALHTGK